MTGPQANRDAILAITPQTAAASGTIDFDIVPASSLETIIVRRIDWSILGTTVAGRADMVVRDDTLSATKWFAVNRGDTIDSLELGRMGLVFPPGNTVNFVLESQTGAVPKLSVLFSRINTMYGANNATHHQKTAFDAPAANTIASIVLTPTAYESFALDHLNFGYSNTPTAGNLIISVGGVTKLDIDVPSLGNKEMDFQDGYGNSIFYGAPGEVITIALAAGGAAVEGNLSLIYH